MRITARRGPGQWRAVSRSALYEIELSGGTRSDGLTVGQDTQIDSECLLDERRGGWLGIK